MDLSQHTLHAANAENQTSGSFVFTDGQVSHRVPFADLKDYFVVPKGGRLEVRTEHANGVSAPFFVGGNRDVQLLNRAWDDYRGH